MLSVDTEFLEVFDRGRSKQVAANSRYHENVRTTKTSRDRLIRPFAAEPQIEFLSENCFARLRELVCEGCQIDVGTSNNRDARAPGHKLLKALANAECI